MVLFSSLGFNSSFSEGIFVLFALVFEKLAQRVMDQDLIVKMVCVSPHTGMVVLLWATCVRR